MDALSFYFFYLINGIISFLPLRILYIFSDILFVIFCYFPGYRKNIVYNNLRKSFPEKSEEQIQTIARKFYRHLADLFAEVVKLNHIGKKEHIKRCKLENLEVIEKLWSEGRDAIVVLGHYNNWEYLIHFPLFCKQTCISIYKPLKNKYFDRYLTKLRSKYGMVLTPMSLVAREIIKRRNNGERILVSFLADQTPARADIHYRTAFLNQDTPVFLGAEKIATKYDMAVIFFNHQKVKRGYYKTTVELLLEHTSGLDEYAITEAHIKRLEEIIREKPEYWLWSHRRWKY